MPLEQRINYVFSDCNGIGHQWPELDVEISECMEYQTETYAVNDYLVIVKRDLDLYEILSISAVRIYSN